MGNFFSQLPFFTICAMLAACDASWNRSNEPGLRSDLTELLARPNLPAGNFTCGMIGTTRDAYATLTLSKAEVDRLIQETGLAEYKNPLSNDRLLPPQLPTESSKCPLVAAWEKTPEIRLLAVSNRPPTLRFKSGRNFEYLFFFFKESTGEACLFVSYSYG
ncbi:MAG: hypothetical protein WCF18_18735 [Chthoniobacteraceae bacterium]